MQLILIAKVNQTEWLQFAIIPSGSPSGSGSPCFRPCLLWPNGWIDEDASLYESIDLGPGHIVLDGDPAPPRERGTASAPLFSAHVWPRSPISATAELLLDILSRF